MTNNPDLDRLFFRADDEIRDGKIVDAFETLSQILEEDSTYGKAYNHLGWMYETKYKDYIKAEECYKLALKYAPEYLAGYMNYAVLLSTIEKYDALEAHLTRSLEIKGINKSKIHNEFGIMYEMQGKYAQSIESYRNALRTSLNNDDIAIYEKSIDRCNKKASI
jgi:tetratricopeptide (TPR) repeat protein